MAIEVQPHLAEFAQGHGADAAFAEVHLDDVLPGRLHALHFEWFDLQSAPNALNLSGILPYAVRHDRQTVQFRLGIPHVVNEGSLMPKYVIERNVPGAGKLGPADLTAITRKSCEVLNGLGPQIEWVQSYVTGDKLYCLYVAPNEDLIRQHALRGGFPANSISEVTAVIGPVKG